MTPYLSKDIGQHHWIGELYESGGWKRCSLHHIEREEEGGSTSWPIAEIDIVAHPSMDGINAHTEINISLRNDIRLVRNGIDVDKNKTQLRHIEDIVPRSTLDSVISALLELGYVSSPFSVCVCIRHVEEYFVQGDFYSAD